MGWPADKQAGLLGFAGRQVGYCQGMGFVVGMLLMYLSEQDAFRSLVKLMVVGELRVLYLPGTTTYLSLPLQCSFEKKLCGQVVLGCQR